MNKLYELLGGRKATFGILLFIISIVLVFTNKVDGGAWLNYTQWIFTAFVGANAITYIGCKDGDCKIKK
jgi:hypothetical protein